MDNEAILHVPWCAQLTGGDLVVESPHVVVGEHLLANVAYSLNDGLEIAASVMSSASRRDRASSTVFKRPDRNSTVKSKPKSLLIH